MPSACFSSAVTGIEPPPPMNTAGAAPSVVERIAGLAEGRRLDREADRRAGTMLDELDLAVRRQAWRTKSRKEARIAWGSWSKTSRKEILAEAWAGITVLKPAPW